MKEMDINTIRKIQLEILIDVADFCEKNNLRYFLSGGTLLGAIRHDGFIPWDDDIDIQMPRPDYENFIHSYNHEKFQVYCWDNDKDFLCTYAKVVNTDTILIENCSFGKLLGVNIDVFPVDGLPSNEKKIKNIVFINKLLWGLVACATINDISNRSKIKQIEISIIKSFYKIFPVKSYVTGKAIKMSKKYNFENSNKVATLVWGNGLKEVINKSTATEYHKKSFEGNFFNIPVNYEDYLINKYGDYMKLPPENERIYKHDIKVYLK